MSRNRPVHGNLIGAVAIIIGTAIGAGVLGLPYVFAKAGFLIGLFHLVALGGVVLLMNLMVGEITTRGSKFHQLAGLAEKYLGWKGKTVMLVSMTVGIWGALIAYTIGVGAALQEIFGVKILFGLPGELAFSLIFFIVASAIMFSGLKSVEKFEVLLGLAMLIVLFAVGGISLIKMNPINLVTLNWASVAIPFGVVIFALLATASVPEVCLELKNSKHLIKKAILIGSIIPIIVYAFFALAVVGATGIKTTEIAVIGLGELIGPYMIWFGNLFAIVAMSSSFLILSLCLKDMFQFDFKMNKFLAFSLTVFIPLIVFLLGLKSFISVLGVTGALAGGLDGIVIALMWVKARKKKGIKPAYKVKFKYAHWILLIVFTAGIVYTAANLLGLL